MFSVSLSVSFGYRFWMFLVSGVIEGFLGYDLGFHFGFIYVSLGFHLGFLWGIAICFFRMSFRVH